MNSVMKSSVLLLLLLGLVAETSALIDPKCPLLTANLDACVSISGIADIALGTSPAPSVCCQGLRDVVQAIVNLSLDSTTACHCIKDYLATNLLSVNVIVQLQLKCGVDLGFDLNTC